MKLIHCLRRYIPFLPALTAGALLCPLTGSGTIIKTTDPDVVNAFQAGATIESFDDLDAFAITSYASGQTIPGSAQFSSRDGNTQPTFHSGGGSFNDPVGNPGTPIGIVDPEGGIGGDVVSPNNVAAPLVVGTELLFGSGFMEIVFPTEVSRVGFWVTEGPILLALRDNTGSQHSSGDVTVTGLKGEFIGIERDSADIKIAALFGAAGAEAFTIDDVTFAVGDTAPPVPDTGGLANIAIAGMSLVWASRRFSRTRA